MEGWVTETHEIWRIAVRMESQQYVSNGAVGTWKRSHQKSSSKKAAVSRSGFCPPKTAGWAVLRVVFNSSGKSEAFRWGGREQNLIQNLEAFWRAIVERNPARSVKDAGGGEPTWARVLARTSILWKAYARPRVHYYHPSHCSVYVLGGCLTHLSWRINSSSQVDFYYFLIN